MAMVIRALNSTAMSQAGYDKATRQLTIWFNKGPSQTYAGVPERIWLGLISDLSPGTYYDESIKGVY